LLVYRFWVGLGELAYLFVVFNAILVSEEAWEHQLGAITHGVDGRIYEKQSFSEES